MLLKLAFRNLRRSIRDYSIYFFTLTMAVTLYQMFLTATSQEVTEGLVRRTGIGDTMKIIGYFILGILSFLIIYANRFMLKRRSREMGTYMTLGMKPRRMGLMLTIEIGFLNLLAVILGVILGTLSAQWMTLFVRKAYELPVDSLRFIYSHEVTLRTILSFTLITCAVLFLIIVQIRRLQLIDLIRPSRRQKHPGKRRTHLTGLVLILALATLGTAFYLIESIPHQQTFAEGRFWLALLLGIIGTYLLMASVIHFVLMLVRRFPRFYYRHLNLLLFRNLGARVNTFWVSLASICLMIFFTIGVATVAFVYGDVDQSETQAYVDALEQDRMYLYETNINLKADQIEDAPTTQHDELRTIQRSVIDAARAKLEDPGSQASADFSSFHPLPVFRPTYAFDSLKAFTHADQELPASAVPSYASLEAYYLSQLFNFVRRSDADRYLADYDLTLPGTAQDTIMLASSSDKEFVDFVEELRARDLGLSIELMRDAVPITIKPTHYLADPAHWPLLAYYHKLVLVVPDTLIDSWDFGRYGVRISCDLSETSTIDSRLSFIEQTRASLDAYGVSYNLATFDYPRLRQLRLEENANLGLVAVYFSVNFLITAATLLALQFLGEITDNRRRYRLITALGSRPASIRRTLIKESASYFLLPFVCASLFSIFTIRFIGSDLLVKDIWLATRKGLLAILAIGLFLAIYFIITTFLTIRIVMTPTEHDASTPQ